MNKRNIIKTIAVLFIAIFCVMCMGACGNKGENSVKEEIKEKEFYLQASPTSLLCHESNTAFSNGFIYYGKDNKLYEYDTIEGKLAVIDPKLEANTWLSCYSLYDGYIFAVKRVYSTADNSESYSIVKVDYNTGDVTEIYVPDDKLDIIGCMTVSKDGKLYFSQGHFVSGDKDEDGYNNDFYIYSYDIGSGECNRIVCGNTYYIADGKIYFTRLNADSDTERLFYAELSSANQVTDMGIDVATMVSAGGQYVYYPTDGKVYYSARDNKLMCYDMEKKDSSVVCTFCDDSYVRFFQYWNDKMIVLLREPRNGKSGYHYGLYYIDETGEPVKVLDDSDFNKDYLYDFEAIDYMIVFNDCDEYFLLSNYDPSDERRVYLVDKDFKLTKAITIGDWDYKAYEEEQKEIERIMSAGQNGGQQ